MKGGFTALQALVQEYQSTQFGSPPLPEAHRLAHAMVREAGLVGTSVERYWFLWAVCSLLNQEPFCRYWKKRPPSKMAWRRKLAARAKATEQALLRQKTSSQRKR